MPKCPNCGLETARTEDWACQWCAYPLVSGGYKKLPMTFRQLQAEKAPAPEPPARVEPVPKPAPEPEVIPLPEPEVIPEPEVVPEPEVTPEQAPATTPEPEVIPLPGPEVIPEPEAVPEPEAELEPAVIPEPEVIPLPGPEVIPEPESVPEPEAESEPAVIPEPEKIPEPEIIPEAAPVPEVKTPSEPAPALEPHPESGIIEASVAQLNATFRQDKAGTNAKLKDSILQVTGVVDKIVLREHLDIQYLLLSSGSNQDRFNVRCTFGSQQGAVLRRLTEGESVTVKGSYGGYERNIMLKDCAMAG